MSKTMQDKETKGWKERLQTFKVVRRCERVRGREFLTYERKELFSIIEELEQEAERRGARSVFTKDELGTISIVFHFYKTEIEELNLRKPLIWGEVISLKEKLVKLLEEENGKQE